MTVTQNIGADGSEARNEASFSLSQHLKEVLEKPHDDNASLWNESTVANESTIASSGNSENGHDSNGKSGSAEIFTPHEEENGARDMLLTKPDSFVPFLSSDLPELGQVTLEEQSEFLLLAWALLVTRNGESEDGVSSTFTWGVSADSVTEATVPGCTLVSDSIAAIREIRQSNESLLNNGPIFFGTSNVAAVGEVSRCSFISQYIGILTYSSSGNFPSKYS